MGSDSDGGQHPPFSPIHGYQQPQTNREVEPVIGASPLGSESDGRSTTPMATIMPSVPPRSVLVLWKDVASLLETQKQVIWKLAVDSLTEAHRYQFSSDDARWFVNNYMKSIISILLEQYPFKIGPMEKGCVEDSIRAAIKIVIDDLKAKLEITAGESNVLEVLAMIFNRKKNYYKVTKTTWNSDAVGLPEARIAMIAKFRNLRGFKVLGDYLLARTRSSEFPSVEILHQILSAASEALPVQTSNDELVLLRTWEDDLIGVGRAMMEYLESCSEDSLKRQSHENLSTLRYDLYRIFDRFASSRRIEFYSYFDFARKFALKLITSQSLPLRLCGWEAVTDLVETSADHRPPPRTYVVSGAGCPMVNGLYEYSGPVTVDGFAKPGSDVRYELQLPTKEKRPDGSEKRRTLTLFRCTMRSQQKWWFLSEADEAQPGTDKDIDYYQHKSKKHEELIPPCNGWITCKSNGSSGIDPPPILEARGLVAPSGQERNTLEHQLAKWAIENNIVELVLGDSIHREIVARSTHLIKFLAFMCNRESELIDDSNESTLQKSYCLKINHLKLAWRIVINKLDAAVSSEVLTLLVCILPSLPDDLAVALLSEVQQCFGSSTGKGDFLLDVGEFCYVLATSSPADRDRDKAPISMTQYSATVRMEILKLMWNILNHQDASGLKYYDNIKDFVASELRVEPLGAIERSSLLRKCQESLSILAANIGEAIDEARAMQTVNLTLFVLEACPTEQAAQIITADNGALAVLLFDELVAYLRRFASSLGKSQVLRNTHSNTELAQRLFIIRYVYGISIGLSLTISQLDTLWNLCVNAVDREAVMVFLAYASVDLSNSAELPISSWVENLTRPSNSCNGSFISRQLRAAYSKEVKDYVMRNLLCSNKLDWGDLGWKAYQSFQSLTMEYRDHSSNFLWSNRLAVDSLWRICLESGSDLVASQAMADLLSLYTTVQPDSHVSLSTQNVDESCFTDARGFADRIYEVLKRLAYDNHVSLRCAERCCRILITAVNPDKKEELRTCGLNSSTLIAISSCTNLNDFYKTVPHGLRGQACYRTISVLARRTQIQSLSVESSTTSCSQLPSTHRFAMQVHPLEPLGSVKRKISQYCNHDLNLVRPLSVNGRRVASTDASSINLNIEPDDATVSSLGIFDGSEIVVLLAHPPVSDNRQLNDGRMSGKIKSLSLVDILFGSTSLKDPNNFYELLLDVIDAVGKGTSEDPKRAMVFNLFWDLLSSIPTYGGIINRVRSAAQCPITTFIPDPMVLDTSRNDDEWNSLLATSSMQRSVYVLQVIDSFLNPAFEIVHNIYDEKRDSLLSFLQADCSLFRKGFIETGGFEAVVSFFSRACSVSDFCSLEIGHSSILRIIKCCFTGIVQADIFEKDNPGTYCQPDDSGRVLMAFIGDPLALLRNFVTAVLRDRTASEAAVADTLLLMRIVLDGNDQVVSAFANFDSALAEKFTVLSLLWTKEGLSISSLCTEARIRKIAADFILQVPNFIFFALPWIISALGTLDVSSESSSELFFVLLRVVESNHASLQDSNIAERLATTVCKKIAACPRLFGDDYNLDRSIGVLCGCLRLLQAIIVHARPEVLCDGVEFLLDVMDLPGWYQLSAFNTVESNKNKVLVNLIGVIFDRFFEGDEIKSLPALCSDKESRCLAFNIIAAAAEACSAGEAFTYLTKRIRQMVEAASPSLLHRWGCNYNPSGSIQTMSVAKSRYSGLRNQGCTCYMNSVLQQLFMMPGLRKNLCSATLPLSMRSFIGRNFSHGTDLIGKRILLLWESGSSYEALVEGFDEQTGMHTIRYLPLRQGQDTSSGLPKLLPDEFVLSEGRPGKEIGTITIMTSAVTENNANGDICSKQTGNFSEPKRCEESDEECASRRLLEEIQRTFVHLEEGSRGRCFDPRSLVEACACLKLEFDVWQQNDASEFAMKLLDRLEPALKKWSPDVFKYLENTFRLKQIKQKICKECGMKTNREEHLMNIDCQIRGKSSIDEALAAMCDVEYMEGDNKVFCDQCKKKCDTILRTAISALPDVLILSLKRFDLDYNTFETVKLNSRCAFSHTLNMKNYTLEALDRSTATTTDVSETSTDSLMDTDDKDTTQLPSLSGDDYDYRLAGILVHAGVAQGGHYYSLIKDRSVRTSDDSSRWFKFDDEEVTPFDPNSIETECFGGKVKKETKWPNGQIQTVESEQFANALMLFYEKVTPSRQSSDNEIDSRMDDSEERNGESDLMSGYDAFLRDVRRSNTAHSQNSFLFDSGFQTFVKGFLKIFTCPPEDSSKTNCHNATLAQIENPAFSWRLDLFQMCLSYYFDILLHSDDCIVLDEWTDSLSAVLRYFAVCARSFLHDITLRTKSVRKNWFRTYLLDCPDSSSRSCAVKIFDTAFHTCLSVKAEQAVLQLWTRSTSELLKPWQEPSSDNRTVPTPIRLDFDEENPSCLGSIISYLAFLLEFAPLAWRYSANMFDFIAGIASYDDEPYSSLLRSALIESQFPARFICLLIRENAPQFVKRLFPGASLSAETVQRIVKTEVSNQYLPLPPSSVTVTVTQSHQVGTPTSLDYSYPLRALAAVLGIKEVRYKPLLYYTGEMSKGRRLVSLTKNSVDALTTVFNEWASARGMGQREINKYMNHCDIDASHQSHHIMQLLNKYGNGNCLLLDGFLAYYCDMAQTNQENVLQDLYRCGFRPNLSRRPDAVRFYPVNDRVVLYDYDESIALDVGMILSKDPALELGAIARIALSSLNFYSLAFSANIHLTSYILAWSFFDYDTARFLIETLRMFYRAQPSWNGSDISHTCTRIFTILAAIPDKYQKERINIIMTCSDRVQPNSDVGCGLLITGKAIYSSRQSQNAYSTDYRNLSGILERYIDTLNELKRQREVSKWLSEYKSKWIWVDQLLGSGSSGSNLNQNSSFIGRKDEVPVFTAPTSGQYNNTIYSDSEGNPDLNYSDEDEEDDEDSRYDPVDGSPHFFENVVASGAGIESINGVYSSNGLNDSVKKYTKHGKIDGKLELFSLFRCKLNDGSRRWYISIVPRNVSPGTNKDIDFYFAKATGDQYENPPLDNWVTVLSQARDPPPKISYGVSEDEELVEQTIERAEGSMPSGYPR